MKRILVTGSSGFIGSHLSRILLSQGYNVLGIDLKSAPFECNNYTHIICDILDRDKLVNIFSDFALDIVLHLAARIDLDGKTLNSYETNIGGVLNIVKAINTTPSIKRCIFTSSQLVCSVGYIPKNDQDYKPTTFYGKSKVLTEKIVRENEGGGVDWCIVRPTTIWGSGMSKHYQKFFRSIKNGIYFHVGHKPLYKSYGYVGNTAYQYLKLMEAPADKINGRVFYLADYEPLSLRKWVDALAFEFKAKPVRTFPVPFARIVAKIGDGINMIGYKSFPFNSFRLNNVLTEYQLDLRNVQEVCGSLPFTVQQGIIETAKWLLSNNIILSCKNKKNVP
jgi:nucleoside-diphosphate-sugar epimerase